MRRRKQVGELYFRRSLYGGASTMILGSTDATDDVENSKNVLTGK